MSRSFRFEPTDDGFQVYYRGRNIGEVIPAKEASGRHCFYLGCDDRSEPRTYRGKTRAAEALLTVDRLASDFKKRRWAPHKLIIMAWDARPRASEAP